MSKEFRSTEGRKSGGRISFWNVPCKPRGRDASTRIESNCLSLSEGLVSLTGGIDATKRAEASCSAVGLVALHGGHPRRRARENVPRRDASPRGRLLLDRE